MVKLNKENYTVKGLFWSLTGPNIKENIKMAYSMVLESMIIRMEINMSENLIKVTMMATVYCISQMVAY